MRLPACRRTEGSTAGSSRISYGPPPSDKTEQEVNFSLLDKRTGKEIDKDHIVKGVSREAPRKAGVIGLRGSC
jgi:hypothetical protein